MTPLRIVFMGSSEFSVASLAALLEAGHDVCAVYAQPPRPAGRGHEERPCPVHAFALDRGLSVLTPKNFKNQADLAAFAAHGADVGVVAAYGLILPVAVLSAPRLGCVNVHASLLPRWRGAAPIQRAILAGDAETGISIMQMDEGLDTGPVLVAEATPITATATAQELHDTLATLGARLLLEALEGLQAGALSPQPQDDARVTYAAKLERGEGRLDWTRPAVELDRMVRALNPWPGVWFEHGGERIKVLAAETADGAGAPGDVLDDALCVVCGSGALRLMRLQRPGKAAMDADAFLRGYALPRGTGLN